MRQSNSALEEIISQKREASCKELDELFAGLGPVTADEIMGEWRVGFLFTKEGTGSKWETLVRHSPVRLYGKRFLNMNNVKAWVFRVLGIKFGFPGTSAVLRKMEFRNKISVSMIYNHLPLIDHFRKLNEKIILGIMETRGKLCVYFYLYKD